MMFGIRGQGAGDPGRAGVYGIVRGQISGTHGDRVAQPALEPVLGI